MRIKVLVTIFNNGDRSCLLFAVKALCAFMCVDALNSISGYSSHEKRGVCLVTLC